MRTYPTQNLDPKIKNVWRINDLIWIVAFFLFCLAFALVFVVAFPDDEWPLWIMIGVIAFYVVLFVLCVLVLPPIRYARWRFDISPDYLEIARGIVWRKRIVIPFIRVQNTDTKQGPVLRAFKLASVTVSTAAGAHEIPGLRDEDAAELRDRAAEFARLAREDV